MPERSQWRSLAPIQRHLYVGSDRHSRDFLPSSWAKSEENQEDILNGHVSRQNGRYVNQRGAWFMDGLEEQLRCLVTEACRHRAGSVQRQKSLTKIIRLISKKLWKENTPYYEDALQKTWVYFCQNICEGNTGEPYDPTSGSVATWLNAYLKRRLQDFYIDAKKRQATTAPRQIQRSRAGEATETLDPVDNLEATPDVPPLLEDVRTWVQTDADGELSSIHIKGHPEVTCQVLILRRLPPEASWKTLAAEFGVSVPTLSSFYQRQCMPRLRKFGESEGYL